MLTIDLFLIKGHEPFVNDFHYFNKSYDIFHFIVTLAIFNIGMV